MTAAAKPIDDNDLLRRGGLSPDPFKDAAPIVAAEPIADAADPVVGVIPKWKTLPQRVLELGNAGPRIRTGIPLLDRLTRGGFKAGVAVFGGQPGAGKTTITAQMAVNFAQDGVHVCYLAGDEGAEGILSRFGQGRDFDRDRIERADPDTLKALASNLADLTCLTIVDGGDEGATLEACTAELLSRANGGPCVLIADSIQRVRASGTDGATDLRLRSNCVTDAGKRSAALGVTVIFTSELNRSSYSAKDPSQRIDDLASFKESGGIEYAADVAIVLRCVPGEPDGTIDVSIPKNRWGKKTALAGRLFQDPDRATFSEIDLPVAEGNAAPDLEVRLLGDMQTVRETLRARPGIAGKQALVDAVSGMSTGRVREAFRALNAAGEIEDRPDGRRPRLYLATPKVSQVSRVSRQSPGESLVSRSPNSPTPLRGGELGGDLAGRADSKDLPGDLDLDIGEVAS